MEYSFIVFIYIVYIACSGKWCILPKMINRSIVTVKVSSSIFQFFKYTFVSLEGLMNHTFILIVVLFTFFMYHDSFSA